MKIEPFIRRVIVVTGTIPADPTFFAFLAFFCGHSHRRI